MKIPVNSSSRTVISQSKDDIENREGNGANQKPDKEGKLVKLFLIFEGKDSSLKDAQRRNGSHLTSSTSSCSNFTDWETVS